VELYPFSTIKSLKEDDVRFWTLMKCHWLWKWTP
jgi:hypothetical protein